MPGRARAVESGRELEQEVARLAETLGLDVQRQVSVGRRIWGAKRRIDLVLKEPTFRIVLGVECKYQGGSGTAEEKIPAIIQDIEAWPIRGIVVFSGPGFSDNLKYFMLSTGKAVEISELADWMKLYFAL